jgi:hypothetical protein
MALLGRGDRLHRTIGWLWRTLDTGPAMRRFAKSMLVPPPDDPPIAPDGRVQWRTRYDNKRARRRPARADAQRFFAYWGASATRQRQLTELLEMFDDDGIEVVVFQVPTRDRFWDYANRKYADKVKAYNKAVREASKGHDVYLFWGGKEHRLRAQNFYDYGHLRDKPAQRFTSKIAKLIRTAYADELKAARAEAPAEVAPRAHAPPGRTKRPRAKK